MLLFLFFTKTHVIIKNILLNNCPKAKIEQQITNNE